jgi:hypothetical protein
MVVQEACVANTGRLCLSVGAAMLATACAASHAKRLDAQPQPWPAANIHIGFPLEPCVGTMLSRSGTFRRTYVVIASHRGVRVNLALEPNRNAHTRAVTAMRSFAGGDRVAEIRLQTLNDLVELIAHEMEHVREQLEGTNLSLLSVARSSDVQRSGATFETRRGIETGLRVVNEVGHTAVRMCDASVRSAARRPFPF